MKTTSNSRSQNQLHFNNNFNITQDIANEMLMLVSADTTRNEWVSILMSLKSEFGDFIKQIAKEWSATASNFNAKDFESTWKSIDSAGGVTIATLVNKAKDSGYQFTPISQADIVQFRHEQTLRKQKQAEQIKAERKAELERHLDASKRAESIFNHSMPANVNHPYLVRKQIGIYDLKMDDQGRLIIPLFGTQDPFNAEFQSLQFISPGGSKKLLTGAKKTGAHYPVLNQGYYQIVIAEGFATAATLAEHYTPQSTVLFAIDAGNMVHVASAMRSFYPKAQIFIAGDADEAGVKAANKAAIASGGKVMIPPFKPKQITKKCNDWNDFFMMEAA